MGEIADALRRARAGVSKSGQTPPSRTPRAEAPTPGADPNVPSQAAHPTDAAIVKGDGPELEVCRQLALRLRSQLERREVRSVAVVSALRDEGKTVTSCNLALALASLAPGRSVALLDLDLRKPSIAKVLGIAPKVGVESFLTGSAPLDEVRVPLQEVPLDVYPALTPPRSAHEVLSRDPLGELIGELERRYELVLVDTPPMLLVPDARQILERVAVAVPVARAGTTRVRAFRELLEEIPQRQVLCTLLNGKRGGVAYYQQYAYAESPDPQLGSSRGPAHG